MPAVARPVVVITSRHRDRAGQGPRGRIPEPQQDEEAAPELEPQEPPPPGHVYCRLPTEDGAGSELIALKVGYTGDIKGGKQHGIGTQVFANGDVYRGDWVHGRIEGQGCYVYRSGAAYVGSFTSNARHGRGRWVPPPGSGEGPWEGTWDNGARVCPNPLEVPSAQDTSLETRHARRRTTGVAAVAAGQGEADSVTSDEDVEDPLRVLSFGTLEPPRPATPEWLQSPGAGLGGESEWRGAATAAAEAAGMMFRVETGGDVETIHYNGRDRALFLLCPNHPLRRKLIKLLWSAPFQRTVFFLIMANAVFIALDTRQPREVDGMADAVEIAGYIFSIAFIAEALMKIVALGFIMHPHSYLRVPVNILDFAVVLSGIAPYTPYFDVVFPAGVNGASLLRLLRPVRVMSVIPGMRVIIVALTRSWHGVLDVSLLLAVVLVLFAVVGVSMFSGLFSQTCYYYAWTDATRSEYQVLLVQNDTGVPCSTSSSYGRQCAANGFVPPFAGDSRLPGNGEQVCEIHHHLYHYWPKNFDNSLRAALVVFQVIAGDDWPWVVHQTQSAAGWWSGMTYHVVLTVFGTFLTINLFLAVLLEKYSETNQEMEEARAARSEERAELRHVFSLELGRMNAVNREEALERLRIAEGRCNYCLRNAKRKFLAKLFAIFPGIPRVRPFLSERAISGRVINAVILVVTVYNIVVMSLERYGQGDRMTRFIDISNLTSGCIFVLEAFAKLVGQGARHYLFVRVTDGVGQELVLKKEPREFERERMGSIFGGALEINTTVDGYNLFDLLLALASLPEIFSGNGGMLQIFRVFRVFRLVRVYRRIAGKRFNVLVTAISTSLRAVAFVLLTLLLFLFIYGLMGIRLFQEAFPNPGQRNNFNTIWNAMLTVFVSSTGDSWTYTMVDAQAGSGKQWAPYVFFISMFVIGNYCLINMIAAAVVDGFAMASQEEPDSDEELPDAEAEAQDAARAVRGWFAGSLQQLKHRRVSVMQTSIYQGEQKAQKKQLGDKGADGPKWRWRVQLLMNDSVLLKVLKVVLDSTQYKVFRTLYIVAFDVAGLAFERPTLEEDPGPGSVTQEYLDLMHIAATAITTVEVILRYLAYGFESRILKVDVVLLGVGYYGGIAIRPLRGARSLRYTHLYLTSDGRRILLVSLGYAIKGLMQVVVVCAFVWLLFSILGMQLFLGRLRYCTDSSVETEFECTGNFTVEQTIADGPINVTQQRVWLSQKFGFDHLGDAIWTLFQVSTGDAWSSVMYAAIDSRGLDERGYRRNPKVDANPQYLLFFMAFMIVGGIFAINLFVGVLTSEFASAKEQKMQEHSAGLEGEELVWIRLLEAAKQLKPDPHPRLPHGPGPRFFVVFRQLCFRCIKTNTFRYGIIFFILFNVAVLAAHHHGQSEAQDTLEWVLGIVFASVFAAEAVIKITAISPRVYLLSRWNRFDLFLAVFGVVAQGVPELPLIYMLRVLRILRLTQNSKSMVRLFETIAGSLQGIFDVLLLLMGVYFAFGCIGVQAFGRVLPTPGQLLETQNFRNLRNAILTLYASSTLARWRNIKDGCSITPEDSVCTSEEGNCGVNGTWLFFLLFVLFGGFVCINLFITIVFESFDAQLAEGEASRFELLGSAVKLWEQADFECASQLEPRRCLAYFRVLLDPNFAGGWRAKLSKGDTSRPFTSLLWKLPIPVYGVPKKDQEKSVVKKSASPRHQRGAMRFKGDWFKKKSVKYNLQVRFEHVIGALTRTLCPTITVDDAARIKEAVPQLQIFTGHEAIFFFVHWFAAQRLISSFQRLVMRRRRLAAERAEAVPLGIAASGAEEGGAGDASGDVPEEEGAEGFAPAADTTAVPGQVESPEERRPVPTAPELAEAPEEHGPTPGEGTTPPEP
eukprot:TRINITY_DN70322_c0_g1_i1.p1 TRINITY_DN70322_c0_g1~~TRINITY_DN70322_c0_g1_i1.p1  ORF type:complete len:1870 (+),score=560.89 TRINITY_DN70322_c0_g1_i1:129-5738(+)